MLIVGLLGLLALGGYYVYANRGGMDTANQNATPTAAVTATPTGTTSTESGMTGEVKIVEVEAGSFYFKPNQITVKKGEKVRLTLKSVSMMHDFVVDELGIRTPITTDGNSNTVEFTANTAGRFEYYCSVGNHRKNGQVGTLVVEE